MKKFLCLASILIAGMLSAHASQVTYKVDNTTVFSNPERGFTEELSSIVSEEKPNVVKGHLSSNWGKKYNMTMLLVLYNFNHYKAQDLPDKILTGFDEDMQALREQGLKCVLRFAYTEDRADDVDATPEWVKRHLEQLKPHLAANADVIYTIEAGFIGVWGEWYYTKNYGNESQHMNPNRRAVIDALMENVPSDRFVLFRYPMIKTEYLAGMPDESLRVEGWIPMTEKEGFTGTVRARMGCHNDAFLNGWGNDGTYASDEEGDDPIVRDYVAKEAMFVPNGGETNVESNSAAERVYANAPGEMSSYHWSFCGSQYAVAVTKRWKDSGIFDTLNVHMGYRYNLIDAQFSDAAAPTGKMNVTIRIQNAGYAPMYNERVAYIVLKPTSGQAVSIALQADPRRWNPIFATRAINEQVELPADLPEGTYHLYLHLPDKYASIADNPKYAVRFANVDVWDENTGYNDLGADITISKTAPLDPGDLPEVVEGIETVSNQQAALNPRKVIENGIMYIVLPDGKKYSVLGK